MSTHAERLAEELRGRDPKFVPPRPPLYPIGTRVTFYYGGYHLPLTGVVDTIDAPGNFWTYNVVNEDGTEFDCLEEEHLSIEEEGK